MILPKRKPIRLSGYDYSQNGYYFVTICTQDRKCLFGNIFNEKMVLNNVGMIIKNNWGMLPNRFSVELDVFQIMPNHVHTIVAIVGAGSSRPIDAGSSRPTLGQIIGYFKYQTTKQINNGSGNPIDDGLGNPIDGGSENPTPTGGYRVIQKIWQRNYYEHIIRNETELLKIRKYIKSNPKMWEKDRNNPLNV